MAIGIVRLEVSKWVPNLGAVVKTLIFLALGILGLSALFHGKKPANDSRPRRFYRNGTTAWPTFRRSSTPRSDSNYELRRSGEMRNPQRDVPRVILWSEL